MFEPLKNVYYFFEDKWYNLLDKIDTILPIYKVVDQIDRVIPSFILFLLVILFLIVLLGYFIQFGETYDVVLHVVDGKTKANLQGVSVYGEINGESFDEETNEDGESFLFLTANKKNLYQKLTSFIFGEEQTEFIAILSAEKKGYLKIFEQEILLEEKRARIELMPTNQIDGNNPDPPINYPNSTIVVLVDSENGETIIDSTRDASVRYRCANKTINAKEAKDIDDGSIDGEFKLTEPKCQFVVVSAKSKNYEDYLGPKTLPTNLNRHTVELVRIGGEQNGRVKAYVFEKNSSPRKPIAGARVELIDAYGERAAIATTDNSGVALIQNVSPNKYRAKAGTMDLNYLPINTDANIFANVFAGQLTEITLMLERIDPINARVIKLRIIDSNNDANISSAKIFPQKIAKTGDQFDSIGPIGTCQNNCLTNNYGIVTATGFTQNDQNSIIVSIQKQGYLIKVIKPALVRPNDPPTVIELDKASQSNSGNAKVKVKSKSTQFPLVDADAYLYMNLTDLQINRVKIYDPIKTDTNGESLFEGLPSGADRNYLARAALSSALSDYTKEKRLNAGQTIIFDINLDMNLSYIQVQLLDYNHSQIPTENTAQIKLFPLVNGEVIAQETESLLYLPSQRAFKSKNYETTAEFIAQIELANYATSFLEIKGLTPGANNFKAFLYPLSMIDKNVKIFFNGIYANNADLLSGNKAGRINLTNRLDSDNNGYYEKIDVVLGKDLDYNELLAMLAVNEKTGIIGIPFKEISNFIKSEIYSCTPQEKMPINDDNFYIQTNPQCNRTSDEIRGEALGINWKGRLRKGVYYFAAKTKFMPSAKEGDTISFNFAAKEKDSNGIMEDKNSARFTIGDPIIYPDNTAKLAFLVWINGNELNINGFNGGESGSTQVKKDYNEILANRVLVKSSQPNLIKIIVKNVGESDISKVIYGAYSHLGEAGEFSYSSNGTIKFDTENGPTKKEFLIGVMPKDSNQEQSIIFNSKNPRTSQYIVIAAKTGEGAQEQRYKLFIDTITGGYKLIITGAEFLAAVPDQNFDGEIFAQGTNTPVDLSETLLTVKKNCDPNDPNLLNPQGGTQYAAEINQNYFKQQIPGVYAYLKDCLIVDATPNDPTYEPLTKVFYAGSGGSQDPALACIDSRFPAYGDARDAPLEWGQRLQIIIKNGCNSAMNIGVETGLNQEGTCPQILSPLEECTITLIGINKAFNQENEFSDVLGVFPVYIKAKKASSNKRMAIAERLKVHLTDPQQCFAIEKDVFDLVKNPSDNEAIIYNSCQYTLFGDYYIPKTTLDMVGASIEGLAPKYDYVDFNYTIEAVGGSFNTRIQKVARTASAFYSKSVATATPLEIVMDGNYRKYTGFKVTVPSYGGQTRKMMYKWVDLAQGENFGAKIDGNFLIKYRNGQTIQIIPRANFELGPKNAGKCMCDGIVDAGSGCTVAPQENPNEIHCERGNETEAGEGYEGKDMRYGLGYVVFPKGDVESIEFNIIGNTDPTNMLVRAIVLDIEYEEDQPVLEAVGAESRGVINSGAFRIFPIEGVTFILRSFANATVSEKMEKKIEVCKKLMGQEAWVAQNKFYWTKRSTMQQGGAQEYCNSEEGKLAGIQGTLSPVPEAIVLNTLRESEWINSNGDGGFWTNQCAGEECTTLVKKTSTANGFSIESKDKSIVELFVPLCVAQIEPQITPTKEECEGLGVSCDPATGQCQMPQVSAFTAFDAGEYFTKPNSFVLAKIGSVKYQDTLLGNSSIALWVEGNLLKARFLGENYPGYDDSNIRALIINENIDGEEYGILGVIDYIRR